MKIKMTKSFVPELSILQNFSLTLAITRSSSCYHHRSCSHHLQLPFVSDQGQKNITNFFFFFPFFVYTETLPLPLAIAIVPLPMYTLDVTEVSISRNLLSFFLRCDNYSHYQGVKFRLLLRWMNDKQKIVFLLRHPCSL